MSSSRSPHCGHFNWTKDVDHGKAGLMWTDLILLRSGSMQSVRRTAVSGARLSSRPLRHRKPTQPGRHASTEHGTGHDRAGPTDEGFGVRASHIIFIDRMLTLRVVLARLLHQPGRHPDGLRAVQGVAVCRGRLDTALDPPHRRLEPIRRGLVAAEQPAHQVGRAGRLGSKPVSELSRESDRRSEISRVSRLCHAARDA